MNGAVVVRRAEGKRDAAASPSETGVLFCAKRKGETLNASKWRFLDRRGSERGGWREGGTGPEMSLDGIRGCIGSLEGARNPRLVTPRTSSGRTASCP